MNLADVIGKNKQDGIDLIHAQGMSCRIAAEDGVENALVQDYRADRITLVIVGGVITKAFQG